MSAVAGWYQSPADPAGTLRWWDGAAWTSDVWVPAAQPPSSPVRAPVAPAAPTSSGVGAWPHDSASTAAPVAQWQQEATPAASPSFGWQPHAATSGQGSAHTPTITSPPPRRRSVDMMLKAGIAVGVLFIGWWAWGAWQDKQRYDYQATTFIEFPAQNANGIPPSGSLESAEDRVAAYEAVPDENGSYVEAAVDVAAEFGVELRWSDFNDEGPCLKGDVQAEYVTAWFCSAQPHVIHLNRVSEIMPLHLYEPGFVDTIKHELGHHIIYERCEWRDISGPNVEEEGITNSYAVLYLGADREEAARGVADFPEYGTNVDTDAAAARIRAGSCRQADSFR